MPSVKNNLNGYDLSRDWFDFCFENTGTITPTHTALYFFIIEHCNRLGWKEVFGLPMEMAKEAIGVKNYKTYSKAFNDLEQFGFIKVIERSKNQYSSNVIALVKNGKATTNALSKAMQKHSQKQVHGIVCIDKPITLEPITLEHSFILEETSVVDKMMKIFKKSNPLYPDDQQKDCTALYQIALKIGKSKGFDQHQITTDKIDDVLIYWETITNFIISDKWFSTRALYDLNNEWQRLVQSMNNSGKNLKTETQNATATVRRIEEERNKEILGIKN